MGLDSKYGYTDLSVCSVVDCLAGKKGNGGTNIVMGEWRCVVLLSEAVGRVEILRKIRRAGFWGDHV